MERGFMARDEFITVAISADLPFQPSAYKPKDGISKPPGFNLNLTLVWEETGEYQLCTEKYQCQTDGLNCRGPFRLARVAEMGSLGLEVSR